MNTRIGFHALFSIGLLATLETTIAAEVSPDPRSCRPSGEQTSVCEFGLPENALSQLMASIESGTRSTQAHYSWLTVRTNQPPTARFWGSAAYASASNSMVIFAGRHQTATEPGPWFGDAWALDLRTSQWTRQGANGALSPPVRDRTSAVYDSRRNQLVIYGGYDGASGYLNDVWLLDFGTQKWMQAETIGAQPHYRNGHVAAYDARNHRMIMFGGYYYDGATWHTLTDAWSLDLDTMRWTQLLTSGEPPPTSDYSSAYDSTSRMLYVYGGYDFGMTDYADHLWRLNTESLEWTDLSVPGTHPGPRDAFSLVFDPSSRALIMHGGHDFDGESSRYYRALDTCAGLIGVDENRARRRSVACLRAPLRDPGSPLAHARLGRTPGRVATSVGPYVHVPTIQSSSAAEAGVSGEVDRTRSA